MTRSYIIESLEYVDNNSKLILNVPEDYLYSYKDNLESKRKTVVVGTI